LIKALEIVMRNNIVKFNDKYARQISGTAMGKPPAPCWANIFEGLHEKDFLPKWRPFLPSYKRFIDDVHAVWLPPAGMAHEEREASWIDFKAEVNSNHGLEWEFSERSLSVTFLDLTIEIKSDGKLNTTLYEKPMALYLFIPPHSAHPPGVLMSHINGNILRIFRLNSDEREMTDDVLTFFRRFIQRGHSSEMLKPIFDKAIANARKFMATSQQKRNEIKARQMENACRRLYLHVEFHPQNPTSSEIQQAFHECMLQPPRKERLNEIEVFGEKVPIDSMIIAYHRAKNLGDIFSYRDISRKTRPPTNAQH